ncbi:hypothetical protein RJ640_009211 [Escallonia rubra]|uniref:Uncharacterized protein n=1 Tax=Escallonia rubra TaxID=112253 RepID=A0AA88QF12_9ASTE|nr:hypothetical protein RJ640_009211 [Escallonia rubra]
MSMMGELTFFLGLQNKQSKDGIFINQSKYTKELLKRFDMEASNAFHTPMSSSLKLDKDEKESNAFDTPMSSSLKLDKDEKGKDVDIKRYRENGLIIPMKDGLDGIKIPKGIFEMDAHEPQLFSMDDKAKNIISCGLDMNEYNRVSACETAREMWRLLEFTHEGTNQVKETRINMLVQHYEAFKMKEHKSINEMYSRFTLIINGLKLLGKIYPEKKSCPKVLRSLPKRWEAKLTAIQEAENLNVLKLEELVGSLMTHEITMKIHDEDETTSKKKNLALKAETSHEPAESSDDSDPEMALITRRFKKFLASRRDGKIRKNPTNQSHQRNNSDWNVKENSDACYECGRTGHIKKNIVRNSRTKLQATTVETSKKRSSSPGKPC